MDNNLLRTCMIISTSKTEWYVRNSYPNTAQPKPTTLQTAQEAWSKFSQILTLPDAIRHT
jgi:hypothetical protein